MRSSIPTGILTGLIVSIWLISGFALLTALPLQLPQATLRTLTGVLGLVILFIGILYAVKNSKARMADNQFSYFMAFRSGLTVAIIVAIMVSLASFVYVKFINPQFAEDMMKEAETSLKTSGASNQEISEKLTRIQKEFSLSSQIIAPLIVQTLAGTVFSLYSHFSSKTKSNHEIFSFSID